VCAHVFVRVCVCVCVRVCGCVCLCIFVLVRLNMCVIVHVLSRLERMNAWGNVRLSLCVYAYSGM